MLSGISLLASEQVIQDQKKRGGGNKKWKRVRIGKD